MTYADRRRALRDLLRTQGLPAVHVSDLLNIRYLTGFTGSNAALLVPVDAEPVLFTDGRYGEQARQQAGDVEIIVTRALLDESLKQAPAGVAAETHHLAVDDWERLQRPRSSGPLVEQLRVTKDDGEIAAIRAACELSVEALAGLVEGPVIGRTECDLAHDLEGRMFALGAEDKAFDTIVAAGENSAIPHHEPTDRVVGRGDLLKIDFGARVDGYHADCTRTFAVGAPDAFAREIHAVVRTAQQAGVDALMAGNGLRDIWQVVIDQLAAAGWAHAFTTGLSHGVGLAIHEDPYPGPRAIGTLDRRTVLTMEPGIYVPGRGGVRIEDTVLVTDGAPEVLTNMSTQLQEIG